MPTTRLPDINTGFARYRAAVANAIDAGAWDKAIGSIKAFNSLLPDDADETGQPKYRVTFSTPLHRQLTAAKITAECPACHEAIPRTEIKPYEVKLPPATRLIAGRASVKLWKCPKCEKTPRMDKTNFTKHSIAEPHFLGVIPDPPVRPPGLAGRTPYETKARAWVMLAMPELEARAAQYRDDNWTRQDDDPDAIDA